MLGWRVASAAVQQARREVERASQRAVAFHPNPAAHHLHQLGADREPQARSAEAARSGPVGLLERFEDDALFVGGDPDARIADGEENGRLA